MFNIVSLKFKDYEMFRTMFLDYFINDCHVKYDVEKLRQNLINQTILPQHERGLIFIDVIKQKLNCVGFIIYQIDQEESDWNERLGCGFIREFYIKPEFRKQGLGSRLLSYAENKLKELNVAEVYLTSQENETVKKFYEKQGYKTQHKRAKNGNEYFEKQL